MSWRIAPRTAVALAFMLGSTGLVRAQLILNGSFENTSPTPPSSQQITVNPAGSDVSDPTFVTVFDWSRSLGRNVWVQTAATNTILASPVTASPDGGNFLAVDGASSFLSAVSQTVSGLSVGGTYRLSFYEGAGQQNGVPAATLTDHFTVSFGSQTRDGTTYTTSNFDFSGWYRETMDFVATSTSQVLTFAAVGSPNLPPYMVLDGVTLSAVPEPSSLSILSMGLCPLCLGGLYLRRRARIKAVAA